MEHDMTGTAAITEIGHVSLRATDLGASIRNAVEVLGLREVETTGSKAYLAAQDTHHEIVYTKADENAVDHIGVVAGSREDLEAIREGVARRGLTVIAEQPLEDHVEEAFAFVDQDGFTWQVSTRPSAYSITKLGTTGPDRMGHVNIQVRDTLPAVAFLTEVFGMRVSDRIGTDAAFFLRCNTDHHGVAVFKSDKVALHHHAWQTQSVVDLGRLGDRLARRGARLAWGPVRHGAGDNIAAYYVEPSGAVIELYTDLESIYDPDRAERVWREDDLYWINQWDGQVPAGILDHGIPPVAR
jgi:catechol-2,3-dioxygenase